MALLRKKSVNVLKHLSKLAADLEQIAKLEASDIVTVDSRIAVLENEKIAHQAEVDLASKVAGNIRSLIGEA